MKKGFIVISLILLIAACSEVVNIVPNVWQPTIFELDVPDALPPKFVKPDNVPTVEGVALGRMLFYDPILSADSTQSCGSCHEQAFAFTDNGKQFSEGITGAIGTRNSMPIFNLMWHLDGFFWDNRAELLRHQSLLPIQDPVEMNANLDEVIDKLNASSMYKDRFLKAFNIEEVSELELSLALEQFMMTIFSGNSKHDRVKAGLESFTQSEANGEIIFNSEAIPNDPLNYGGDCFHCHNTSLFMGRNSFNNGLDSVLTDKGLGDVTGDSNDDGKFKTPSLRNLSYTAPYMHDGRFNTIEEVIQFYMFGAHANSPNISANMHALQDSVFLSPQHQQDLVAYLLTLNDDSLTVKEAYSNPF